MTISIPPTWAITTLGEVTADVEQRQPVDEEEFIYIDIASVNREKKRIQDPQHLLGHQAPSRARKVVAAGDVIVSMTRPNLNAVAIVPPELDDQIASTGFDVLRAIEIDPRWIFYTVRSNEFIESMSDLVQGALYPAIRSKDIRNYKLALPPLSEQHRIADKLDIMLARVDACRERLERVPVILRRFRQAVLEAALSGELTADWRNSQDLPSWRESSVGSVAMRIFDGPFGSNLKSNDYSSSGIRVIRLENIGHLRFHEDKETYIPDVKYNQLTKHTLLPGDVLFSSFVDEEVRVCMLPDDLPTAAINKADCFCIRVQNGLCLPEFLMYRLATHSTYKELQELVHGATRPRINLKQLREFSFWLPPFTEQQEIVGRTRILLDYAKRLETRYTAAQLQLGYLPSMLLAKAFRGALVPHDPNDEPASVLLDRIRTERTQSAMNESTKRTRKASMTKKISRKKQPAGPIAITDALRETDHELPSHDLLNAAGYPNDATAEEVEEFLVAIREALANNQITRERRDGEDWFSLVKSTIEQ